MRKVEIFFFILGTLLFTTLIWWQNGLSPVNNADKTKKIFVVQKGEGVKSIANNLKKENLIKDSIVFFMLVKKLGIEGKIQAGDFRLSPSQTAEQIAQDLTHGTLDIWITIPEGRRAGEIADILKENLHSFKDSWKTDLAQNEGYLFPDTYLIPRDATSDFVISIMKNNFKNQYAKIAIGNQTQNELVTIASLIEREAKLAEDRPLVSSVIHNRLELGMPLQIDATVQYILGYQENEQRWWKKSLTTDDLKINSPYNTYIHPGLPPTPICSPGLSALQAAANPTNTSYIYYISDSSGHNHYAKTLEEHNANIKKYGL